MLLVDFCGYFTMHAGIAPKIPVQWPVNDKFMDFTPLITTMILFPASILLVPLGSPSQQHFFHRPGDFEWYLLSIGYLRQYVPVIVNVYLKLLTRISHLEHRIATTYHDDCIGWRFNDGGVVCDHKSVTSITKSSAPVAIQKSMTSVKILLCSSYKFNVLLCATGRNSCLANCWCPHDGVSTGWRWRIFSILPSNSVWLVNWFLVTEWSISKWSTFKEADNVACQEPVWLCSCINQFLWPSGSKCPRRRSLCCQWPWEVPMIA